MTQELGKQIVSKGTYAANVGTKVTLSLFGIVLFLLGLFCLIISIVVLVPVLMRMHWSETPGLLIAFGMLCGGSLGLLLFGKQAVIEAKETDTGIPLTRTNTGDLPAPDSLVRASQEPLQARRRFCCARLPRLRRGRRSSCCERRKGRRRYEAKTPT